MNSLEELVESQLAKMYSVKYPDLVKTIEELVKQGNSPDAIAKRLEVQNIPSFTVNNLAIVASYFFKKHFKTYEKSKKG
jgi:hypothetical protein